MFYDRQEPMSRPEFAFGEQQQFPRTAFAPHVDAYQTQWQAEKGGGSLAERVAELEREHALLQGRADAQKEKLQELERRACVFMQMMAALEGLEPE